MHRRALLALTGSSLAASFVGCLAVDSAEPNDDNAEDSDKSSDDNGSEAAPATRASVTIHSDHETNGRPPTYGIYPEYIEDPGDVVDFEALSPAVQREFATAVARGRFRTYGSPEMSESDIRRPVAYEGLYINPVIASGTPIPRSGDDWDNPVELTATIDESDLTLTFSNGGDEPLTVSHLNRPYFGVLLAWDGDPLVLPHEQYESNPTIEITDDLVYTTPSREIDPSASSSANLAPGESLEETYRIPETLSAEHTTYLDFSYSVGSINTSGVGTISFGS